MLRQQGLSGSQGLTFCFVFSQIMDCSLTEKCNGGEMTYALGFTDPGITLVYRSRERFGCI